MSKRDELEKLIKSAKELDTYDKYNSYYKLGNVSKYLLSLVTVLFALYYIGENIKPFVGNGFVAYTIALFLLGLVEFLKLSLLKISTNDYFKKDLIGMFMLALIPVSISVLTSVGGAVYLADEYNKDYLEQAKVKADSVATQQISVELAQLNKQSDSKEKEIEEFKVINRFDYNLENYADLSYADKRRFEESKRKLEILNREYTDISNRLVAINKSKNDKINSVKVKEDKSIQYVAIGATIFLEVLIILIFIFQAWFADKVLRENNVPKESLELPKKRTKRKSNDLPAAKKKRIIAKLKKGLSARQIAKEEKISVSTVYRLK